MNQNIFERQKKNTSLMESYFALFSAKNFDELEHLWHDQAIFEAAFAPQSFPAQIEGKAAVIANLQALSEKVGSIAYDRIRIFQTTEADRFFVQFHIRMSLPDKSGIYENLNLALIETSAGRIRLFREYFDTSKFAGFLQKLS